MKNIIEEFKKSNISFDITTTDEAVKVLKNEFSAHRLLDVSVIFDKYKTGVNAGKFVKLDFGDLYSLAALDFKFSQLLMYICLEIEKSLKTILTYNVRQRYDTQSFLIEYYNIDKEHIDRFYAKDNLDVLKLTDEVFNIETIEFENFLELVQFGTLERIIHYYCKSADNKEKNDILQVETELYSIRRIRNMVAHGNCLLSKIYIPNDYKNLKLATLLGKHGIKNRNLTCNLSKAIVSDICNLLYVYFVIVPNAEVNKFEEFDLYYNQRATSLIKQNSLINSIYPFFVNTINILKECEF